MAAWGVAAWHCCYRKRGDCMQAMRSTRDIILELCGGRRRPVVEPISSKQIRPQRVPRRFKLGYACKAAQVHTNYRVVVEGS